MEKEIIMLMVGAGISLVTTFLIWLCNHIYNHFGGLDVSLKVMECEGSKLKIKLSCFNKSKVTKYLEHTSVYFCEGTKHLISCENQIDNYSIMRVYHETNSDDTFSFAIPPETIKEVILEFDSAEEIDTEENYRLWFSNKKKVTYPFKINSHNWQKLKKTKER